MSECCRGISSIILVDEEKKIICPSERLPSEYHARELLNETGELARNYLSEQASTRCRHIGIMPYIHGFCPFCEAS